MYSKIIIIIILAPVFYVLFAYSQTKKLINIGNDLADTTVAFSKETGSDKKFLVIGDSSAVGVGATKPEDSIAGRIAAEYPDASIKNLGVNGSKTHELIPRLDKLQDQHFDFILVQTGGNDIVRRTDLSELEQSINTVLQKAKERGTKVVLMTSGNVGTSELLPAGTRWTFTKRTRQVRELFIKVSEKHEVPYVDIFREKPNDPYAHEPKKYYSADMFHPSSEGYADWYTFVSATLKTTFSSDAN